MHNVYSVGQINAYIKNMFSQDFLLQAVLVRGEVSNCKYHTSGHIYFTLKDASGTLSCVMFASRRRGLLFQMKEGDEVVVQGTVDVYERDGKYQLYAAKITRDGAGALNERYEQLKKKLEEQGMFDERYKQPIPKYIRTLGVVTAPTGAAVRDIISVSLRRNPYLQVLLYPAQVQGQGAASSVAAGIRALERAGVDVIIIGRGGGSLEDLWAFNEEELAQAVFDARTPVISAVGHETDTVITDYVADLRAPTPSAAAELAVFEYSTLMREISGFQDSLTKEVRRVIRRDAERAGLFRERLTAFSPASRIRDRRMRAAQLEEKLSDVMSALLLDRRHTLQLFAARLAQYSPLHRLSGGYSYVSDAAGAAVVSARQLKKDDRIRIRLRDGEADARVEKIGLLPEEK